MIRIADTRDAGILAALARELWPHHTEEELQREFDGLLTRFDAACFLAMEEEIPLGFAQCQLRRDYVEGTETSPVGYLEGIYVTETARNRGYARRLLEACENWAREKGCREFASDCELDNGESMKFHLSMGFQEANRIICFTKKLTSN